MHIVVCAKQIADPEAPASAFKIDEATNRVVTPPDTALVVSQFDSIAAEAALRLKESVTGGAKMTVISLGSPSARDTIKQILAMGADEGVLLQDDLFEGGDSYTTACTLAAAIRKLGDVDVVFFGRQAADWDMGQVGTLVSEALGWPIATLAAAVEGGDGTLSVRTVTDDGFTWVSAPMPAVVTVSNELGAARYPRLPQIMAAAKKPVAVWRASDLGLSPESVGAAGSRLHLERLFVPMQTTNVEVITGDTAAEKAKNLVERLRADRLV